MRSLYVLPVVLALTACFDQKPGSIGASADATSDVSAGGSTGTGTREEYQVGRNSKITSTEPALSLVASALKDVPDDMYADKIIQASKPMMAWDNNPIRQKKKVKAEASNWEAVLRFANTLTLEIKNKLPKNAALNRKATKSQIVEIWQSYPKETLDRLWAAAKEAASPVDEIEILPTLDPAWQSPAGSFKGGDAGLVWSRSGTTYFGQGSISGQKVDIALDDSLGATIAVSTNEDSRKEQRSAQSTKASAEVKP